ncbi:hypothetical protein V6N11_063307 [Hibiscus sabdariffa]|uniref:Uncharacterized protein n=1 Tax=Hibiscus sabdariffa TaxID=183260 RepID=A0ABR2NH91_9ROSI
MRIKMDNAFYVEPIGIAGGLAMWWSNEVKLSVLHHDKNLIDTVISINREVEWFGTFIYAPPYEKEKQEFWERLGTLRDNVNVNVKWCIMGDTNIVASPSEKYGGSPFDHNNAKWYHEFLERSLLMEIQSKGGAYTWSNQRSEEDEICEKLDKVTSSLDWSHFPWATSMATTTRQPARSHVVPIIPKSAEPITTCLDPVTSTQSLSSPLASVPVTTPMCQVDHSSASNNQPLVPSQSSS